MAECPAEKKTAQNRERNRRANEDTAPDPTRAGDIRYRPLERLCSFVTETGDYRRPLPPPPGTVCLPFSQCTCHEIPRASVGKEGSGVIGDQEAGRGRLGVEARD